MFLKFKVAITLLIQKHLKTLQIILKSFGTRQNNFPLLLHFSGLSAAVQRMAGSQKAFPQFLWSTTVQGSGTVVAFAQELGRKLIQKAPHTFLEPANSCYLLIFSFVPHFIYLIFICLFSTMLPDISERQ